jgi:hypothetical protein
VDDRGERSRDPGPDFKTRRNVTKHPVGDDFKFLLQSAQSCFFSRPRIFPEKHRKPLFSWVKADRITQHHENKKTTQQRLH